MADTGDGVDIHGVLDGSGDTDTYQVVLRAGEVYDIWLGGNDAPPVSQLTLADPVLDLVGPGATALNDDNSAEGRDANLIFSPTVSGTYTITVSESGGGAGDYRLTFTDRSFDADISDNIFATDSSGGLPVSAGFKGTSAVLNQGDVLISDLNASREVGGNLDDDVVAVFLKSGETYNFTVGGGTAPDPDLFLVDADGQQVDFDDSAISNFDPATSLGTGWYFLIPTFGGSTDGTYQLQFTSSTDNPVDVPGGTATLVNVPLNGAVQGEILDGAGAATPEDGSDWYAINLVAGARYQFDLANLSGTLDPFLRLHDSGGAIVTFDDNSGPGASAQITFMAATSGLYFLEVVDATGPATGTFQLSATLLSTPTTPVHSIDALADSQIDGSDVNDSISGGDTADSIRGSAGDDTLVGELGNDTLGGQSGNDSIDGGPGTDQITGDAGNDTLGGGDDNDTIDGGTGANHLNGGNGNDLFQNVGAGTTVSGGTGIDTVEATSFFVLGADVENLTLLGSVNTNGVGNNGNNVIFGSNGINQLSGLGGNDALNGGLGNDTLIGGAGKDLNTGSGGLDHIKYNALSESGTTFGTRDAISTFAHGDKIDLSAIDANTAVAGNQAFTFVANFTHHAGEVQFDQVATNAFLVTADVNGDAVADFSLNVYTSAGFGTFHNWDFIL